MPRTKIRFWNKYRYIEFSCVPLVYISNLAKKKSSKGICPNSQKAIFSFQIKDSIAARICQETHFCYFCQEKKSLRKKRHSLLFDKNAGIRAKVNIKDTRQIVVFEFKRYTLGFSKSRTIKFSKEI